MRAVKAVLGLVVILAAAAGGLFALFKKSGWL